MPTATTTLFDRLFNRDVAASPSARPIEERGSEPTDDDELDVAGDELTVDNDTLHLDGDELVAN